MQLCGSSYAGAVDYVMVLEKASIAGFAFS